MKPLKYKIILFLFLLLCAMFFSNDFGLVDIEKTAIITAISIDLDDGEYLATAQIAVPEATNTTSENKKTQISGKGATVGEALKNVGNISGWYPQLSFCNLIVLGNELSNDNVILVLDYFAKTLRVQDSALIVLSKTTGKDVLKATSPLDNLSAFAVQKILLKNPGFDKDTVKTDVKEFSSKYYSKGESSLLPIIEIIKEKDENESGNSESNSEEKTSGKDIFNATNTALFYKGKKVGELDGNGTRTYNLLTDDFNGSTISIKDVDSPVGKHNYLLTVVNAKSKIDLSVDDGATVNISVDIFCNISDENAVYSDDAHFKNIPLSAELKQKAENDITKNITELVNMSINTNCDFLDLKEQLYRFHNEKYNEYKDNLLSVMGYNIKVNVYGQS